MRILKFYEEFQSKFNEAKIEFVEALEENEISDKKWTMFMENLLQNIFKEQELNCISQHKLGKQDKNVRKEFLNIDFSVFKNPNLEIISDWVTEYAIEHENKPSRIGYNIAKLLNVKASNKVFIGYTQNEEEKDEYFDSIISEISKIRDKKPSYFRLDEKLLLILGHYGMSEAEDYKTKLIYLNSGRVRSNFSK